jgi:hypothetical protein
MVSKFLRKIVRTKYIYLIFILTIVISVYLYRIHTIQEPFTEYKINAFCLITTKPDNIWIEFLNTFTNIYDVYIVIDDNNFDITQYKDKHPNINFIQISEEESKANGYWDASYLIKKEVIAWDKALYYFARLNRQYKNVWFCEDDVYIRDVNVISNIDTKYSATDLLSANKMNNTTGEIHSWMHWVKAQEVFDLPWSGCWVSFCRVSSKLLANIDTFVKENGKLTFLEILIPNIADKNKLSIEHPTELSGIDPAPKNIDMVVDNSIVYHAIKNTTEHMKLRKK